MALVFRQARDILVHPGEADVSNGSWWTDVTCNSDTQPVLRDSQRMTQDIRFQLEGLLAEIKGEHQRKQQLGHTFPTQNTWIRVMCENTSLENCTQATIGECDAGQDNRRKGSERHTQQKRELASRTISLLAQVDHLLIHKCPHHTQRLCLITVHRGKSVPYLHELHTMIVVTLP